MSYRVQLGAQAVCLDQNQNTIDCQDPNCTYGDCGAPSATVASSGCLDQKENQVSCTDPECTYGDCAPATPAPAARPAVTTFPSTIALPPGPSPRIAVPLSISIPGSVGMWLSNNYAIVIAAVGSVLLLSGGGRRRRR